MAVISFFVVWILGVKPVISDHKELDLGTLRAILSQTEVSVEQLNQLLRESL